MRKIIGVLLSTLVMWSCSNENNEPVDPEIKVVAMYNTGIVDKDHIDTGAKAFVYYGKESYDFLHTVYDKDGVFLKQDSLISPDQTVEIDQSGSAVFTPKYQDRSFTVVVESFYYNPRLMHFVFPSAKSSLTIKAIFNP